MLIQFSSKTVEVHQLCSNVYKAALKKTVISSSSSVRLSSSSVSAVS